MAPRISARERELLHECAWYLNLEEMREFCATHALPLYIHVEALDGSLRRSSDRDRKDIVIQRILAFALHGRVDGPTIYSSAVVANEPLPHRITARTRVHYGQYEKKNPRFVAALQELTDGAFRTGMIARLVLREFWTAGKAPTMSQLAKAWLEATAAHTKRRPEGAYLLDLSRGEAGADWKQVRIAKAKEALRILGKLVSS